MHIHANEVGGSLPSTRSGGSRPQRPNAAGPFNDTVHLAVQIGAIGILDVDLILDWVRLSAELCAIAGLPAGTEMSCESTFGLFDERDRAAFSTALRGDADAGGDGSWYGVYRILHATGGFCWVAMRGQRFYQDTTAGRKAIRCIATVTDITEQKRAEMAVLEKELHLRLALEAANMGTFEADLTATTAVLDEKAAELFGLPRGTTVISAEELRKRIPLEDLSASDKKKEQMVSEHVPYQHEFRFSMPDGSERWLSGHAAVRDDRIFGVAFDITQRKHAETQLRESEARLGAATTGAALGIFEWDVEKDRVLWENPRIRQLFGHDLADHFAGIANYVHREDIGALTSTLENCRRTGRRVHAVFRIKPRTGGARWLQLDGTFSKGVDAKTALLLGVVADITARKRLERRAQLLAARIETIQAQERRNIAQELHDSTVQHLVGASLLLMKIRSTHPSTGHDEALWTKADHCIDEAIRELRTFAYVMHPPALRLRSPQANIRQYAEEFAARSGLQVKLRLTAAIGAIPLQIHHALLRVVQEGLANVYRHASASRAVIELRCIAGRLHLIIADNGCGPKNANEHQRLRPSRRSGVGLLGIKARLEELSGKLRVRSITPHGSKLHVSVPVETHLEQIMPRAKSRAAPVEHYTHDRS
jgi:PAS domain S-box-containing protein